VQNPACERSARADAGSTRCHPYSAACASGANNPDSIAGADQHTSASTTFPIARGATEQKSVPPFPALEVFGRRPRQHVAPSSWGRHPKTFTEGDIQAGFPVLLRSRAIGALFNSQTKSASQLFCSYFGIRDIQARGIAADGEPGHIVIVAPDSGRRTMAKGKLRRFRGLPLTVPASVATHLSLARRGPTATGILSHLIRASPTARTSTSLTETITTAMSMTEAVSAAEMAKVTAEPARMGTVTLATPLTPSPSMKPTTQLMEQAETRLIATPARDDADPDGDRFDREARSAQPMAVALSSPSEASGQSDAIWVLLTNATGDNAQCLELAELLDMPFRLIHVDWRASNAAQDRLAAKQLLADTREAQEKRRTIGLQAPWPKIVIGSGRRSGRIGLWIKARSEGRTKYIAIGRARAQPNRYDLLVAPPQFALPDRPNIVRLRLPLVCSNRRLTYERALKRSTTIDHLIPVPRPWFSILLGGEVKEFKTSEQALIEVARTVQAAAEKHGGSVVVSTSRRTPEMALRAVKAALDERAYIYRWSPSDREHNPYQELLACSAALFVTADSASMISDACASGIPTYIIEYPPRRDIRRAWRRSLFRAIQATVAFCHRLGWIRASRSLDRAQEWLHNNKLLRYPRDLRRLLAAVYDLGLAQPAATFHWQSLPSHRKSAHDQLHRIDVQDLIARCHDLLKPLGALPED